ncbi:hypothetical protein StrepF001_10660 [Streptomyces sp. F001]|nr:hypothetical protein StrepF001_10660 [Streptomyces sp. F001]
MEAFAAEMLGSLARRDRRAKGELYVCGLMLDGKRKSMQPMAERLGVDHQQLQQFISSSTWDYVECGGGWPAGRRRTSPRRRTRLTTAASPRTAMAPLGWPGCTAAPWASAALARQA